MFYTMVNAAVNVVAVDAAAIKWSDVVFFCDSQKQALQYSIL